MARHTISPSGPCQRYRRGLWNFDPDTTAARWAGTENTCTITGLQSTTTYYVRVAALDVWKPTSWNYSARITHATADS